jgi:hypothetical protein
MLEMETSGTQDDPNRISGRFGLIALYKPAT